MWITDAAIHRMTESVSQEGAKEIILNSALKLFTQKSYFKTSVADIARESDVSSGSIYHLFKNKEAIAKALYDDLMGRLDDSLAEIRRTNKTAADRTRAVVDLLFTLTEEAPDVMRFLLLSNHREFIPDEKPLNSSSAFEGFREILSDGIKTGEIRRMNPVTAYASFYGIVLQSIRLRLEGLLEKPIGSYVQEIWGSAWRAVARR